MPNQEGRLGRTLSLEEFLGADISAVATVMGVGMLGPPVLLCQAGSSEPQLTCSCNAAWGLGHSAAHDSSPQSSWDSVCSCLVALGSYQTLTLWFAVLVRVP